ncbi:bifunctional DNA primase/polymerase, partial [Streptomyces sp. NPDC001999]
MGFTIGGIREMRSGARRRGRTAECTAVAEYTGLWGWAVAPGRPSPKICCDGDSRRSRR